MVCQDIYSVAHCAPFGPWVIRPFTARHLVNHGLSSSSAQLVAGDAHGAMRTLLWHEDQKAVCAIILAICIEAQI